MSLWAQRGVSGGAFAAVRKGRGQLEAVEWLKGFTRERFGLDPDETVLVREMECSAPGFPPLETLVAFWTADGTRHHFKVFKPVALVMEHDVPPAWLKDSLALSEGVECACC
jgi:nitrate reductase delta subunit